MAKPKWASTPVKAAEYILEAIRRAKPYLKGKTFKAAHQSEGIMAVASKQAGSTYKRKNKVRKKRTPSDKKKD